MHPTLTKEGLGGATTERLRNAIAAVCTPQRLTKITLINSGPEGDDWVGQAVSRDADGTLAKLDIPGMEGDGDKTAAVFVMSLDDDENFAGFGRPRARPSPAPASPRSPGATSTPSAISAKNPPSCPASSTRLQPRQRS